MMFYDYNKRSYLLPPGCKDLIDLLRLDQQRKQLPIQFPMLKPGESYVVGTQEILGAWKLKKTKSKQPSMDSISIPSIKEVAIPDEILVLELANAAGQKPFRIIADLME